jgi:hypothetical protein
MSLAARRWPRPVAQVARAWNPFNALATDGHLLLSKGEPMDIGRFLAKSSGGNSAPYQTSVDKAAPKTQGKGTQAGNGVSALADRNASAAPASAKLKAPAPQATVAQTPIANREVSVGEVGISSRGIPKARSEASLGVGLRRLIHNGNGLASGLLSNERTERAAVNEFAQCNGFSVDEFRAAIDQKCKSMEANAKFTPDLNSKDHRIVGGSLASRAKILGELRLGLNAARAAHAEYIANPSSYVAGLKDDFNSGPTDKQLWDEADRLPAAGDSLLKMHMALSALEKQAGIRPPSPKG